MSSPVHISISRSLQYSADSSHLVTGHVERALINLAAQILLGNRGAHVQLNGCGRLWPMEHLPNALPQCMTFLHLQSCPPKGSSALLHPNNLEM
mmetsp:Transcript_27812/g.64841  ORF Transcript_27812/g.64841 Transcript_27812/m.64841 type:complete len:94 (-) Transcript_27812:127-408(-)